MLYKLVTAPLAQTNSAVPLPSTSDGGTTGGLEKKSRRKRTHTKQSVPKLDSLTFTSSVT